MFGLPFLRRGNEGEASKTNKNDTARKQIKRSG